jgi:hypothetical protein
MSRTKKHIKHKPHLAKKTRARKHVKKHMSKKRRNTKRRNTKRRYSRQRGGLFNSRETDILKQKLKVIGFTDENEINNILGEMGTFSQRFSGVYIRDLTDEMDKLNNKEEFKRWLNEIKPDFDDDVDTDYEWDDDDDE